VGFLQSLEYLQKLAGQEEALVEPDSTTIKEEDRLSKIKLHLVSLCGVVSTDYWDTRIEQHQDWIIESEDYEEEDEDGDEE